MKGPQMGGLGNDRGDLRMPRQLDYALETTLWAITVLSFARDGTRARERGSRAAELL